MFRFAPTARLSLRVLIGIAAAGVGAAMSLAALPVAVANLIEASGDPVLRQIEERRAVDAPALREFIRSRESAARWRRTARTYTDIALGHVLLTEDANASQRRENLALAEAALARGLGLAPMDHYGWMRLVQVRTMHGASAPDVSAPLRLALLSGPHEDRRDAMLLLTLEAGLRVWDDLDGSERRLIEDKAREAWRRDARAAASTAVRAEKTQLLARLLGF